MLWAVVAWSTRRNVGVGDMALHVPVMRALCYGIHDYPLNAQLPTVLVGTSIDV
jgi:hypothetical protein